jgi:hypothetical protein
MTAEATESDYFLKKLFFLSVLSASSVGYPNSS